MSEKFIGYFRLLDACAQRGCPACRCVRESGRLHLDALIYEQVTDADTRRRLRASWGFCNMHAWRLLEIENSYLGRDHLRRSPGPPRPSRASARRPLEGRPLRVLALRARMAARATDDCRAEPPPRSEEHTSELQSLAYLV